MAFLRFLLIGFAAGWIVGRALRGRSFGWVGSTLLGGLGSLLGGYLFGFFGFTVSSLAGALAMAVVGAVTLLLLVSFLKPSHSRAKAKDDE